MLYYTFLNGTFHGLCNYGTYGTTTVVMYFIYSQFCKFAGQSKILYSKKKQSK